MGIIKALVKAKADVDILCRFGGREVTPLMLAVQHQPADVVSVLVDALARVRHEEGRKEEEVAPIDVQDSHDHTALVFAVRKGYAKTAATLVRAGASLLGTPQPQRMERPSAGAGHPRPALAQSHVAALQQR